MVAGVTERMEHQRGFLIVLLVLASLLNNVAAEKRILDLAPDAVDDTYSNCFGKMKTIVTKSGGLLQKELEASSGFKEIWREGENVCEKRIPGGDRYHTIALQAYGNSKSKFRKMFNQLVYTKGSNSTTYVDGFPFKSLHFLLTDAFRLTNESQACSTVYYGTENQYEAKLNDKVRFGKFIKSEIKRSVALENIELEGLGTLFIIRSCLVIKVDDYTCSSEEVNSLISPNEAFIVMNITKVDTDDATYTAITLKNNGFISNHDCYLISSADADPKSSSVQLNSSVLALITSIFIYFTLV